MATISEGINWLKTLQTRHQELIQLRDNNARLIVTRNMALNTSEEQKPTYDAKKLDRRITLLAREIRLCNDGIKRANAVTQVSGYEIQEDVLGELEGPDSETPAAT